MGSSRGYGGTYSGSGSSSSYLSAYGTPRSNYRQSSYEPRLSYGGSSVMDRVKQFASDNRGGSYTPLSSRRAAGRDYGGGSSWDRHSSRSAGSDYSNRSGYMSDFGGSNPSLYSSWDRASSRSGRGYGAHSRETSPVGSRNPRQFDYNSSATPSPYSTYRSNTDLRSPSANRRFERQNSARSDVYEESPRPRRKWETGVYGSSSQREPLPEPVKHPPPKDYSDSDDSAPEDDKDHMLRYMTSRGTSPMPEPGKRDRRSRGESTSSISKVKRVKYPQKETRSGRNSRSDMRRKRLVDCATQTNISEATPQRRTRGEKRDSRDDMVKMAALALLNEDNDDSSERYHKHREKFAQSPPPKSPHHQGKQDQPEQRGGWRKAVYDDTPPQRSNRNEQQSKRDSRYNDTLDVPDEKSWRKSVYGDQEISPSRLRHYQTEEDLTKVVDGPKNRRGPMTSTPNAHKPPPHPDRYETSEQEPPPKRDRRSQYSENEKRRSQNESENYRRSSSRDSMLDDKPSRRRRQRTSSRELLDETDSPRQSRTPLTPDSLSLRESIEKVHNWKQNLPTSDHLTVNTAHRHPETGFPRSDSGEYFSAHEHNSHEGDKQYREKVYAQNAPMSPTYHDQTSDPEEILSPGGSRRRKGRRHLSRELSQESNVFDEDRTHHPVNKERMRKSELNRSLEKEKYEQEELERRQRIYGGEEPDEVDRNYRNRRSGNSSEGFSRDESPNRRRRRYGSRQGSREDNLDERVTRRDKREVDPHASDSSQFGFNREGSPNRPSSRNKRRSRHSSREDILDNEASQYHQDQYMRPHSMISNESLANLSAASSIPSMHSVMTNEGTIQNSASMQSMVSNEAQERPPDDRFPQSASQQSMESSGGSLPDIVPGEEGSRPSISKTPQKAALISATADIDNLLNFSPNEEEFVEKGKIMNSSIKGHAAHLLDAPVPRAPSPMKPNVKGIYYYCCYFYCHSVNIRLLNPLPKNHDFEQPRIRKLLKHCGER